MRRIVPLMALLVLGTVSAEPRTKAELKLHALFGDNMVLQGGMMTPVWGTAEPGEEVAVTFLDQKKAAKADAEGKWRIRLDILKPGGPFEMTVAGKKAITVKNVLVGEVWLASGQSNMEMSVKSSASSQEEIAKANYPKIRLFTVPRRQADAPQSDVVGAWQECTPRTVPDFSAVAYFFGRELQKDLDVPIGLIHSSVGGTAAELWTRRDVIERTAELGDFIDFYAKRQAAHEKLVEKHKEDAEKAKAEGKPAPPAPKAPRKISCLYNAMIAPLVPYGIRGAIWYQGESNAGNAKLYRTLFPAMIQNWREDWGQGDFPFLFVQLANFMARKPQPGESNWAELRESQLKTLSLHNTGMAVIIDIGDAKDIHPKNKQDVGRRLELAALRVAYDRKVVHSGPIYQSMNVEDNKARLSFRHAGGGLVAKGEKLAGFAVAGEDRKFVWAEAKIEGETVVVWSDQVARPAAVRYAWADNPECNLYNKEGLPASPFRTDEWPRPQQ